MKVKSKEIRERIVERVSRIYRAELDCSRVQGKLDD